MILKVLQYHWIALSPRRTKNPQQPQTVVDDKVAAEPPPTDQTVTLSPKVSALARKEQAQRQREAAIAKREKDLEVKLADAEKYQQLKDKLANKDFSAAAELGLTYEEYQKYELDKISSTDPAEQRFRKVEEELTNFKKAEEERTVKEYQANQALWKSEISKIGNRQR